MKKIRSIVCLVLCLAMVATVMGCTGPAITSGETSATGSAEAVETEGVAAGAKSSSDITVGLALYTVGVPFYAAMEEYAKKHAEENGYKLIALNAEGKLENQLMNFEDLIASQVDVICFVPVDPDATMACVNAANQAGIPVIAFNDTISDQADVVTNWVRDYYETAQLSGYYAGSLIGNNPVNVVMMNGQPGVAATSERQLGALAGLTEYQLEKYNKTTFTVVAQGWANWAYEDAVSAMEDIMASLSDTTIDVLFTGNDTMALGALDAMRDAGRLDELKVLAAAADGQKEGVDAILNGKYDGKYVCTGLSSPTVNVGAALDIALAVAKGKTDFPRVIHPESVLITKENATEYFDPNGVF